MTLRPTGEIHGEQADSFIGFCKTMHPGEDQSGESSVHILNGVMCDPRYL
jgi:hypothetical protein